MGTDVPGPIPREIQVAIGSLQNLAWIPLERQFLSLCREIYTSF